MNNSIDRIIENAIEDLVQDFPGLVASITCEGSFITRIKDSSGALYTIVDFEESMTYDPKEFHEHSQRLYELFANIPRWYK